MNIFDLKRKLQGLRDSNFGSIPVTVNTNVTQQAKNRIENITNRVGAKEPIKNEWGSNDYPINVGEYSQFLAALETLRWTLSDLGYQTVWLSKGGLTFDHKEFYQRTNLFDKNSSLIVALVAVGPKKTYRFSRDMKSLRIRAFNDYARAISPMRDGDTTGSKVLSTGVAKEIVEFAKRQSTLDVKDAETIQQWARFNTYMKPVTASVLKTRVKMEFNKVAP